jgi:ABC-type transport system substrate-binding protein
MKSVTGMSIGDLAALVADHLRQSGINVVLTGGSCVSIYTQNRYQSYDLDLWKRFVSIAKRLP